MRLVKSLTAAASLAVVNRGAGTAFGAKHA
jgi:hypothetical protein